MGFMESPFVSQANGREGAFSDSFSSRGSQLPLSLSRIRSRARPGYAAKYDQIRKRIGSEAIASLHSSRAFARRVKIRYRFSRIGAHLGGGIDSHASHSIMDRRTALACIDGRFVNRRSKQLLARGYLCIDTGFAAGVIPADRFDERFGRNVDLGGKLLHAARLVAVPSLHKLGNLVQPVGFYIGAVNDEPHLLVRLLELCV